MTLAQLRKNSGLKQYKLAEYLGITRQQYRNIETGSCRINSQKIDKLATKFGLEPLEVLKAWEESNGKRRGRLL